MSSHEVDTSDSAMSFAAQQLDSGVIVKPLSNALLSPTSIIDAEEPSVSLKKEPRNIRSKVVMSEDGAEITLEMNDLSFEKISTDTLRNFGGLTNVDEKSNHALQDITFTPSRLSKFPTGSLLDSENTPSPSPQKVHNSLSACCGSTHNCYTDITTTERDLQTTISTFLSNSNGMDDWCGSWQAWSYYEMDQMNTEHSMPLKTHVKTVLRNRAGNLRSKSRRLAKLKHDPFATPKKTQKLMKTTSYSFLSAQPQPPNKKNSLFGKLITACGQPQVDSPFVIRTRGLNEEDLCYDSDPEETTRYRLSSNKENSFRSRKYHIKDSFANPMIRMSSDEEIKQRILEVMNDRYKLLWHSEGSQTPVVCFLERGQQLGNGKLLQPRLVFVPSDGKSNPIYGTDLLDITRVLHVNRIDRRKYPFAQRRKCLLVQTLDSKLFLECEGEEDCQWLVHDLKLVVARLGSKIIMDEDDLFDEFFVNDTHGVPGEAPEWAQQEQNNTRTIFDDKKENNIREEACD